MDASSSSSQSPETFPHSSADESQDSLVNDEHTKPPERKSKKKKNNKRLKQNKAVSKESSATSSRSPMSRVVFKRRRMRVGPPRNVDVAEAVSFRLGMSIAAFLFQIMESKDVRSEMMPADADHLAVMCSSAVRESLKNVFGDAFDGFVSNFEKSFQSTFRTLRLLNETSMYKGNSRISEASVEDCTSGGAYGFQDRSSEEDFRANAHRSDHANAHQSDHRETMEVDEGMDLTNLELALLGRTNQLACVSANPFGPLNNRSMLIEKSVMEQTRSNDLKAVELTLTMERMKMKKTQLALNFDLNNLQRSKLVMGESKASFKAEMFKTQQEDVRNTELLRTCVDCLVSGLLIMSASLAYGAYIYSYHKITEATSSCTPSTKKSSSWWISNPMDKLNHGLHMLSCQFQVLVRMAFGFVMILSITYLLVQRSASTKQPITFILLLLALLCGLAGKLCVDTLGGSGSHWLVFWEAICFIHFLSNVFTSVLFSLLYGPLIADGHHGGRRRPRFVAYWVRRLAFYGAVLVVLPLCCGLLPFAGFGEWRDHFWSRIIEYQLISEED